MKVNIAEGGTETHQHNWKKEMTPRKKEKKKWWWLKHSRAGVFKWVNPFTGHPTHGSNSQTGWGHTGAVDGPNQTESRREDRAEHLKERQAHTVLLLVVFDHLSSFVQDYVNHEVLILYFFLGFLTRSSMLSCFTWAPLSNGHTNTFNLTWHDSRQTQTHPQAAWLH